MQDSHVPEDGITEGPRASVRITQTPTAKFSQVPVQNPGSREAFASCRLLLLQPEMSTGTWGMTQSWLCTRSRPRQVVCCGTNKLSHGLALLCCTAVHDNDARGARDKPAPHDIPSHQHQPILCRRQKKQNTATLCKVPDISPAKGTTLVQEKLELTV